MAEIELRLGWVIVYVDEPVRAAGFYEQAFGLRGELAAPDGSYAQLDTGAARTADRRAANWRRGFRRPTYPRRPRLPATAR